MAIYEGISQKLDQMQRTESFELANFLKLSQPELGDLVLKNLWFLRQF